MVFYNPCGMAPRRRYAFWIDDEQRALLDVVKERDGILPSEQIRRALNAWFEEKGVTRKPARRRNPARQQS
jgi:hypothetical protein